MAISGEKTVAANTDLVTLEAEINIAINPAVVVELIYDLDTRLWVETDVVLSGPQEAAMDAAILAHDGQPLAELIVYLLYSAHAYYLTLLDAGFTYSGSTFALDVEAMGTLGSLYDNSGAIAFPFSWNETDGTRFNVADIATLNALYSAGGVALRTLKNNLAVALDNIATAVTKVAAQAAHDAYVP